MSKGNKMNVRKENGTTVFYIKDSRGNETRITSAEILEMKQKGRNAYLRDFLDGNRTIEVPVKEKRTAVVSVQESVAEEPKKKESLTEWAPIPGYSLDEVSSRRNSKPQPRKGSWIKRLFKGGE